MLKEVLQTGDKWYNLETWFYKKEENQRRNKWRERESIIFLLFFIDLKDNSLFDVTLVNSALADYSMCISKANNTKQEGRIGNTVLR